MFARFTRLFGRTFAPPSERHTRSRPGVEPLEDRTVPTATVTAAAIADAFEGGADGVIRFTRTGDTSSSLGIDLSIGGTADNGTDYDYVSFPVEFANGESTVDVHITAGDDAIYDPNETVTLTVVSGMGDYVPGTPAAATIHIVDASTPIVTVTKLADTTEGGTAGTFRVSRTGSTSSSLAVDFTVGGTATSGTDFTSISTSVTIPASASYADVTVTAATDSSVEESETVTLALSNGGTNYYAVGNALLFISDPPPDGTISGSVWSDTDVDGVWDAGESPASGIEVWLYQEGVTGVPKITVIDAGGAYTFSSLFAGSYTVAFVTSPGLSVSTPASGTLTASLSTDQHLTVADAGISPSTGGSASISGLVWNDTDADGIQDLGEAGLPGVAVSLYDDGASVPRATTATDATGQYSFTSLTAGNYDTVVVPPSGMMFTGGATGTVVTTVATGQTVTGVNTGVNAANVATITLNQPTVNGNSITAGGTFNKGGATYVGITIFAANQSSGRLYKKALTTDPGGANWGNSISSLPKGTYTVWAVLQVNPGVTIEVQALSIYKDVGVTAGKGDTTGGVVAWTPQRKPALSIGMKIYYLTGSVTAIAPPGDYMASQVIAYVSRTDLGLTTQLPLTADKQLLNEYPIREGNGGWALPMDLPAGQKYRVAVSVVFKKDKGPDLTFITPFVDIGP